MYPRNNLFLAGLIMSAIFIRCQNLVPEYYTIDDLKVETLAIKNRLRCNMLEVQESFSPNDTLYLLFLFKTRFTDENGKGDQYLFGPGGVGKNGPLSLIQEFRVSISRVDSPELLIDISDRFFRSHILDTVTVFGKGWYEFHYDCNCGSLGLEYITSLEGMVNLYNRNDRRIRQNLLLTNGAAFAYPLITITRGRYLMRSEITFVNGRKIEYKNELGVI